MKNYYLIVYCLVLMFAAGMLTCPNPAVADTREEIDREVKNVLPDLYEQYPNARAMGAKAKGILVFPSIVKGGFVVGGQYDEGALLKGGKTAGYYSTVQVSYGMQAGVQVFGYVLFFMTESALDYLDNSDGWEIGVGPSIVVVDEGMAMSKTTTTLKAEIYAFFVDQKGLMGGLGLQGTKITKIDK